MKKVKEKSEISNVKDTGTENHISPEYVCSTINSIGKDDSIFTVSTGMVFCVWGADYIRGTGKRIMLGSFNRLDARNAMPMVNRGPLAYARQRSSVAFLRRRGIINAFGEICNHIII